MEGETPSLQRHASEGRHPAFPGVRQRAGPMGKRLSALGKAECLPSEALNEDVPSEGRHPAFPARVSAPALWESACRR